MQIVSKQLYMVIYFKVWLLARLVCPTLVSLLSFFYVSVLKLVGSLSRFDKLLGFLLLSLFLGILWGGWFLLVKGFVGRYSIRELVKRYANSPIR